MHRKYGSFSVASGHDEFSSAFRYKTRTQRKCVCAIEQLEKLLQEVQTNIRNRKNALCRYQTWNISSKRFGDRVGSLLDLVFTEISLSCFDCSQAAAGRVEQEKAFTHKAFHKYPHSNY